MSDERDLEQALREHLATVTPALEYTLRPMRIGIDGWRFFDATPMEVNDANPSFFVVREDGTALTGDPTAPSNRSYARWTFTNARRYRPGR